MKYLLDLLSLAVVLICVGAISLLAALDRPVPIVIAAVALAVLSGQLALLRLPSLGPIIVVLACLAAFVALSAINIAVPSSITYLLVASLTGHFALTGLPGVPALSSLFPPSPTPTGEAEPPAVVTSSAAGGTVLGG